MRKTFHFYHNEKIIILRVGSPTSFFPSHPFPKSLIVFRPRASFLCSLPLSSWHLFDWQNSNSNFCVAQHLLYHAKVRRVGSRTDLSVGNPIWNINWDVLVSRLRYFERAWLGCSTNAQRMRWEERIAEHRR